MSYPILAEISIQILADTREMVTDTLRVMSMGRVFMGFCVTLELTLCYIFVFLAMNNNEVDCNNNLQHK